MEHTIIFNESRTKRFKINPETPFFKITKIEIPSIPDNSPNISSLVPNFKMKVRTGNNLDFQEKLLPRLIASPNQQNALFEINEVILENPEHEWIELHYETNEEGKEVKVYYTRFNQLVKIDTTTFYDHLEKRDNAKVLFSGSFGQGKTTFLNSFFEVNKDRYEVFKLYPVNYAISHNEDIFKYIKVELLTQLLGKDVEFDKVTFSYAETAANFFAKNPDELISPLLSLIPKVGKSLSDIFDKLNTLRKKVESHHKESQGDDEEKTIGFIKKMYEKEGSVFEDNFYTQLIRQLIEQLKQKNSKTSVLIIDDIDRMDPEHIFRIFNVFAAHFDSQDVIEGYTNKFGFDKIILVCDYTNIKGLFAHRYGSNISFDGYLSKYYSNAPYYFDNKAEMKGLIKKICTIGIQRDKEMIPAFLESILTDLVYSDQLSLRDLIKLSKNSLFEVVSSLHNGSSHTTTRLQYVQLPSFCAIAFFSKVFDLDSIVEKLKVCGETITQSKHLVYDKCAKICFIPLINVPLGNGEQGFKVTFKSRTYTFNIEEKYDNITVGSTYYYYNNFLCLDSDEIEFTKKDFYELLILNVKKYFSKTY